MNLAEKTAEAMLAVMPHKVLDVARMMQSLHTTLTESAGPTGVPPQQNFTLHLDRDQAATLAIVAMCGFERITKIDEVKP